MPQVASLYEQVARSGSTTAPPGLAAYFEDTFFGDPWADKEIPSLVYVADGRIKGFLGSSVRRFVFDGQPARMAVSGQLVTEPSVRSQAAGAFLVNEYLAGSQDFTVTDTASSDAQRLWEGLGGRTAHLHSVGWVRVFRPWRFGAELRARRRNAEGVPAPIRRVLSGLDAASVRAAAGRLGVPAAGTRSEELSARAVADHLPDVVGGLRLRPAYEDERFLDWLLRELARVRKRGALVARLVHGADGRVRGWYVYYLPAGGIGQVLQVAAGGRGVDDVLDDLFQDARSRGASALQGRVEARLLGPLSRRHCVLHASGYLALVHAPREEILGSIQSGQALVTRLEGDWWMGHHLEPFADEPGRG
ncbi:MAG: hypothetical protein ACRDNG_15185 [Gaiellaceae bacterium]